MFNRGVERRDLFIDAGDADRFVECLQAFNVKDNIGSLWSQKFESRAEIILDERPLVSVVAYCLNPNHFHLILKQVEKDGMSKYMKRLAGGYSRYFNEKEKRSGALFQGPYKAVHISTNEQLLHVSAYVNLNDKVHKLSDQVTKFHNSRDEYFSGKEGFCSTQVVLDQFKSCEVYASFARETVSAIVEDRDAKKNALYM